MQTTQPRRKKDLQCFRGREREKGRETREKERDEREIETRERE
jgi:hypothetical protein